MNKKVFITMLCLSVSFLALCYFLKFFFPQEFVMAVENERIIQIANFIDSNFILYYIVGGLSAFITYWLYCCACTHKLYLKWYECLIILAVVVICRIFNYVDINIMTAVSISSFIFLPALFKGDIKTTAIVYTIHCINQSLTLSIRNLVAYVLNMTTITTMILSIDMYIWLILFYILSNYKKEKEI